MSDINQIYDLIRSDPNMDKYDRNKLLEKAIDNQRFFSPERVQIEKYRIDKLLESGKLTEGNRYKERLLDIFQNSKARWVYIATLSFMLMALNSCQFWKYQFAVLGK